jgi:hypothetical protein
MEINRGTHREKEKKRWKYSKAKRKRDTKDGKTKSHRERQIER